MSRTQHEADICAALVDDVYGELSSRIFTILLQRGRLTIPALIQQSGLRPTLLKQGLVVLIQQNLIYYSHQPSTDITYYEANWDAAFALARTGRIIDIVQARFGDNAKDIVQNLLLLGHTRIGDLVEAYAQKKALLEKAAPKANGLTNGHVDGAGEDVEMTNGDKKVDQQAGLTHGQVDKILYQLLQCGYLQPVSAAIFKSPTDIHTDIEQKLLATQFQGGAKSAKKQDELKAKIREELQHIRDQAAKWHPLPKNNKRPREAFDSIGSDKRRKLTNGASTNGALHELEVEDIRLDSNMVVRVNHEKFAVALRNQHLVELAERYIGVTTAYVYSKVLELMENKIPRCRGDPLIDDPDTVDYAPTLSMMDIMATIPKSLDMSEGIGKPSKDKAISKNGGHDSDYDDVDMTNHTANGDHESDSEEDPSRPLTPARSANKVKFADKKPEPVVDKRARMEQVKQHLLLLADDQRHFVTSVGHGKGNAWTVNFEGLGERLRDLELDAAAFAKFQEKGVRLVRVLREKGKLDEKQICNIALLKQKDVRTMLIEMQMAGFVDIQEIPKDATRVPTKTFFLWYYDSERVTKMVTDNIYKAMCRALKRLDAEKYLEKDAIETSERTDVDGDMTKLEPYTVAKLKIYQKKEELLSGLVAKLDKTAAVFRDY